MKTSLNPAKFSISGYMNTTHVSIDKVKFSKMLLPYIDEKLVYLYKAFDPKKGWSKNKVKFPFTAFPGFIMALKKYNNKVGNETFVCLYYDHNPIGLVDMDIPRCIYVCPQCKAEYNSKLPIVQELAPLTKIQSLVQKVFKEAFQPTILEGMVNKCKCGSSEFKQHIV